LIELNRALVQLRVSGLAAVLETRLLQAQAEAMATIDMISVLVSDELNCRSKRPLEQRHKQAQFRDANKQLDNFQFNPKMNRSLVFIWPLRVGSADAQTHFSLALQEAAEPHRACGYPTGLPCVVSRSARSARKVSRCHCGPRSWLTRTSSPGESQ
jgi:hypothetical protein